MSVLMVERSGQHILLVTINRPEARNAIDGQVTQQLAAAVDMAENDIDVRAVVLTGAGDRAFCAGADLREIAAGNVRSIVTGTGGFAGFVRAPRAKPWIAAVNGAALAGGCEIALACDMILAADHAVFGLPEVQRGLAAVAGGLYRLPRALPRAIALEMIATGDPLPMADAMRLGMVNRVTSYVELLPAALALAGRIADNAPVAVRESLAIARQAFDADEAMLDAASRNAAARLAKTEDYKEGPRAFIEKRKPIWQGR